jgi:hypothetical protein
MKDGFDINVLSLQLAQNFVDQGAIFHHQKMGIENPGILCPDSFRDLLLHFENLNARLDKRRFEASNLGRDLRRIDRGSESISSRAHRAMTWMGRGQSRETPMP